MQYFKPADENHNVGDCMPFYHDGVYHFIYLLDEKHHQAMGGLGAHQWAHASSRDLIHWEHHPMVLPITMDHECSMCTGSINVIDGVYYAFYATRLSDWSEHMSLATSTDGIHFTKQEPNMFASPPAGYTKSYRDPHLIFDETTGKYHLLITAALANYPMEGLGGCLAQLESTDLKNWTQTEPFYIPGLRGDPECVEHFFWNGWYYLIFSNDGVARYRMSKNLMGPWQTPGTDTLDGPMARVMKSAPFIGNRRIGVAFLPKLTENNDYGGWLYAGNAVFREFVQHEDGTLGTCFPAEMTPCGGEFIELKPDVVLGNFTDDTEGMKLGAGGGVQSVRFAGMPQDYHLDVTIEPGEKACQFGLCLRAADNYEPGYELRLDPAMRKVEVRKTHLGVSDVNGAHSIFNVADLDKPVKLEVVVLGEIIDVCVNGSRCLVNRFPEAKGDNLFLFTLDAEATFKDLQIRPI